jgi:OOP family OmpA-OmpF porin
MNHSRSRLPFLILALAVLASTIVLLVLLFRSPFLHRDIAPPEPVTPQPAAATEQPRTTPEANTPAAGPNTPPPAEILGTHAANPSDLVDRIGRALETGDMDALQRLIGPDALPADVRQRLATLAASGIRLHKPDGVQEVGELELDQLTRWALRLDGREPGRDRIFFDLRKKDGTWHVERVTLPPAPGETVPHSLMADSLGIADAFLQAALRQNFEQAKEFVDPAGVSDAKIAVLCIMFEEGGYHLRPVKPLRAMFQRGDTAGYLAQVEAEDKSQAAQFAMTMRQPAAHAGWIVAEINLDQLLADYARRVGGGDVYYTPLVKNPKGGDTLVLYFDFDEDHLSARTARQMEIVARILRTDTRKKITISGHTDALGSENYNEQLSLRRANTVRDFLVKCGVAESQVVAIAKGTSQPRRPNFTTTGADNPEGRRANRRSEIYLDF